MGSGGLVVCSSIVVFASYMYFCFCRLHVLLRCQHQAFISVCPSWRSADVSTFDAVLRTQLSLWTGWKYHAKLQTRRDCSLKFYHILKSWGQRLLAFADSQYISCENIAAVTCGEQISVTRAKGAFPWWHRNSVERNKEQGARSKEVRSKEQGGEEQRASRTSTASFLALSSQNNLYLPWQRIWQWSTETRTACFEIHASCKGWPSHKSSNNSKSAEGKDNGWIKGISQTSGHGQRIKFWRSWHRFYQETLGRKLERNSCSFLQCDLPHYRGNKHPVIRKKSSWTRASSFQMHSNCYLLSFVDLLSSSITQYSCVG